MFIMGRLDKISAFQATLAVFSIQVLCGCPISKIEFKNALFEPPRFPAMAPEHLHGHPQGMTLRGQFENDEISHFRVCSGSHIFWVGSSYMEMLRKSVFIPAN